MTDKLIISNTDNYNQDFEFSDTKTYVGRYVELINEYIKNDQSKFTTNEAERVLEKMGFKVYSINKESKLKT